MAQDIGCMIIQADGINLDSSTGGVTFPAGTPWKLDSGGSSFYTLSDFTFKWEKTDSGGVVTEIDQTIFSGNIVLNSLLIFPPCFDSTGLPIACSPSNWQQTNTNLTQGSTGDYVGGYMGDGTYTFTLTRSDGCTASISRNIILGCMKPTNTNYNSAANLDSDGLSNTFYTPPLVKCA
jgi:hypothetical protein